MNVDVIVSRESPFQGAHEEESPGLPPRSIHQYPLTRKKTEKRRDSCAKTRIEPDKSGPSRVKTVPCKDRDKCGIRLIIFFDSSFSGRHPNKRNSRHSNERTPAATWKNQRNYQVAPGSAEGNRQDRVGRGGRPFQKDFEDKKVLDNHGNWC
jgi:hypothetical protein